MTAEAGQLYIVSTPIGNMGDFSFRAVEVLKSVALILAEDTRHSRPLLDRYGITTSLSAYHEHNEAKTTARFVERLLGGESLALISDAGTPLLSDPGQRLVSAAVAAGIRVLPIPGASALLAALVASGLPADRFTYFGFLARKGRERAEVLAEIASSRYTAVLYEAPLRVADTLRELAELAGDREAVVARELTKHFEEIRRGTLEALCAYYTDSPPRGEVVILISGAPITAPDENALRDDARALRAGGMSVRDVAAVLTGRGLARNAAYRLAKDAETTTGGTRRAEGDSDE
ncbi:MAG TPA: 16S rRNA (cytidine(1402)-2'-O)-methyltransferase [Gemmatimonadaceae bacterium]|nr:16S rRNA (cytidine(1402)-2'-O)-methyltransferase [Gemmatimonadaceae bacterium]